MAATSECTKIVYDTPSPLMQARTVGVNRRGCVVLDLACGWELNRVSPIPLPRDVHTRMA